MAEDTEPGGGQKGVQSVEIAAKLLDALARVGGDATLKWISADTGLTPSRAHSYLVSLRRSGLVEQDSSTGHYLLGPQARQIGLAAIDQRDQYDVLLTAAQRLRDETGRTVNLAIWSERGPTVAHWARGREPLTLLVMNSGLNPPLLTTAMGRVFLAFLPDDETEALMTQELNALRGGEVFPGLQEDGAIDALKARIKEQGFAYIKGILSPFVSAVAAPIRDRNGHLLAVLDILGRDLELGKPSLQQAIASMKQVIRRTERELGAEHEKKAPKSDRTRTHPKNNHK